MMAVAEAPSKIILLGEHFVVMGNPAISMAIDLKTHVAVTTRHDGQMMIDFRTAGASGIFAGGKFTPIVRNLEGMRILQPIRMAVDSTLALFGKKEKGLNITITTSVPLASGLGSSASVAVATVKAVAQIFDGEITMRQLLDLAEIAEMEIHGKPSGIDHTTVAVGGIILYKLGVPPSPIEPAEVPRLVIGDTGSTRKTVEMVLKVSEIRSRDPDGMKRLLKASREIVLDGVEALKTGDLKKLGRLMDDNHSLLSELGVSSPKLNRLVDAARKAGALGAKLTGAGGGGCMITLVEAESTRDVLHAIQTEGGKAIEAGISTTGATAVLVQ